MFFHSPNPDRSLQQETISSPLSPLSQSILTNNIINILFHPGNKRATDDLLSLSNTNADAIPTAIRILGLDNNFDNFEKIHTRELKKSYLLYLLIKRESEFIDIKKEEKVNIETNLNIITKKNNWSLEKKSEELNRQLTNLNKKYDYNLNVLKKSYDILLSSEIITGHIDNYSKYSRGLEQLNIRGTYQIPASTTNSNTETQESAPPRDKKILPSDSIIDLGNKQSGAEPGRMTSLQQDVFLAVFELYPDDKTRYQKIEELNNFDALYEQVIDALPSYLLKLIYSITDGENLKPDADDLKRTTTIQNIAEISEILEKIALQIYTLIKTTTITEKLKEAVREAFANAIAGLYIDTQEQYLVRAALPFANESKSFFNHKRLLFLLMGKWIKKSTTLAPIAGSKKGEWNNYCAYPVASPTKDGIAYISDPSINLAPYLVPLLAQGDSDAIGSKAQNKLTIKSVIKTLERINKIITVRKKIIGIDYGKAYQKNIIDDISSDFHVNRKDFKNYTVFYDVLRSEFAKGLIKLALTNNIKVDEDIIKSYGAEFFEETQQIAAGTEQIIADDYKRKMEEIRDEFKDIDDKTNAEAMQEVVADIAQLKLNAEIANKDLIKKFKQYLSVPKEAVDIVDFLEKFIAGKNNTTLRSEDGTLLLKHLRVTDHRPEITIMPSHADNNNHPHDEKYVLKITCDSKKTTDAALKNLGKFIKDNKLLYTIKKSGSSGLEFKCDKNQLNKIHELFHEDNLKKLYHPKDAELYQHYLEEMYLSDLLEAFQEYGVNAKLIAGKSSDSYDIVINENTEIPLIAKIKHAVGAVSYDDKENKICFLKNQLPKITAALEMAYIEIEAEYQQRPQKNEQAVENIMENAAGNITENVINSEIPELLEKEIPLITKKIVQTILRGDTISSAHELEVKLDVTTPKTIKMNTNNIGETEMKKNPQQSDTKKQTEKLIDEFEIVSNTLLQTNPLNSASPTIPTINIAKVPDLSFDDYNFDSTSTTEMSNAKKSGLPSNFIIRNPEEQFTLLVATINDVLTLLKETDSTKSVYSLPALLYPTNPTDNTLSAVLTHFLKNNQTYDSLSSEVLTELKDKIELFLKKDVLKNNQAIYLFLEKIIFISEGMNFNLRKSSSISSNTLISSDPNDEKDYGGLENARMELK